LLSQELDIFTRDEILENWLAAIERIRQLELIAPDETLREWLEESEQVIFEGAQGVLLDAEAGFHPYTTWSNCTTHNAEELIRSFLPGAPVYRIGILRCYAVRHGPGPLPTEDATLSSLIAEHNRSNPWQGPVRYGWFDSLLARYALQVTGGVDCLAVTYLDLLPRLEQWRYCRGYAPLPHSARSESATPERWLTAIPDQRGLSLVERAQLTEAMKKVQPRLESVPPNEAAVLDAIENLLDRPVGFTSRGPRATDVQVRGEFPPGE
jgi:adenylosuccinate synthase